LKTIWNQDILPIGSGRSHDNLRAAERANSLGFLQETDLAKGLQPIHFRHHDVQTNQIVRLVGRQCNSDRIDTFPTIGDDMEGAILL